MKIRLIVPNNNHVSPVQAYGKAIADITGGFTATQATGGWKNDYNVLIVEPVIVFDCAVEGYQNRGIEILFRALAKTIAQDRKQTCVYLEIDGVVEYVTK